MAFSKRVVLRFPRSLVHQPIVSRLIKDYSLDFNILKALVNPKEEGLLVMELMGKRSDFDKAIAYLTEAGVETEPLSRVKRNEERCTQCGACVSMCPTGAFVVDEKTRGVLFDDAKCIACELCLLVCPPRVLELTV
ncbi:MAG: 4Fe-4S binding protein [Chloroflexi bacterium]|nr:4Fe-4S binding protein [Chloroflexota bacterium]MBT7081508.1 4Fe-4S binding protein [Chloroflexota bacterium]MBT7290716.1 4Fe-4S binding protein [Chloroflexota bacterium]